jgi:hypothetical protein
MLKIVSMLIPVLFYLVSISSIFTEYAKEEIGDGFESTEVGEGRGLFDIFNSFKKSVSKSLQRSIGSVQIFLGNSFW